MTGSAEGNPDHDHESAPGDVEQVCDAFRRQWISGAAPRIADYLDRSVEGERVTLFLKLLALDAEQRRQRGDVPTLDDYLSQFPEEVRLLREIIPVLTATPTPGQRKDGADSAHRARRCGRWLSLLLLIGLLLIGGSAAIVYFYRQWTIGYVTLSQSLAPMVLVEIRNAAGDKDIRRITLPYESEIALPAGDYQVKASAPSMLDTTYRMLVTRDTTRHYTIQEHGLDEGASRVVRLCSGWDGRVKVKAVPGDDRDDLLLFSESRIVRSMPLDGNVRWFLGWGDGGTTPTEGERKPLLWQLDTYRSLRAAGDIVLWNNLHLPNRKRTDCKWACRFFRYSGTTGELLWNASECGLVNGPPAVTTTGGLILSRSQWIVPANGQTEVRKPYWTRSVEAWGLKGTRRWKVDLDPNWFQIAASRREMHAVDLGESQEEREESIEFSERKSIEERERQRLNLEMREWLTFPGGGTPADASLRDKRELIGAYPPRIVELSGSSIAMVCAGSYLLGLDTQTGKQVWEPLDLGFVPVRPPQWADFDNDGELDVLLVKWGAGSTGDHERAGAVQAISLKNRQVIWQHKLREEKMRWGWNSWTRSTSTGYSLTGYPGFDWPLVCELEPDDSPVVIAVVKFEHEYFSNEIHCLDGRTGTLLWSTPRNNVQRLFLISDCDGDGVRDLLVVVTGLHRYVNLGPGVHHNKLADDAFALFIYSGRDGRRILASRLRGLEDVEFGSSLNSCPRVSFQDFATLTELNTGNLARQPSFLMVPKSDKPSCVLALDGSVMARVPDLDDVTVADVDGDGIKEVCGITRDGFGRVLIRRLSITHQERWRRLGKWYPVGDLNGDGVHDLVPVEDAPMAAISGKDSTVLWSTSLTGHVSRGKSTTRTPGTLEDLNGDGDPDIVVFSRPSKGIRVRALSGRSGRVLWSTGWNFSFEIEEWDSMERLWYLKRRDVANPDLCILACNGSTTDLLVLSGRTGRVSWHASLESCRRLGTGDLDGDGLSDVVVETVATGSPQEGGQKGPFELHALNGSNGKKMWAKGFSGRRSLRGPAVWAIRSARSESEVGDVVVLDGDQLLVLEGQGAKVRCRQSLEDHLRISWPIDKRHVILSPLANGEVAVWVVSNEQRFTDLFVLGKEGSLARRQVPLGLRDAAVLQVLSAQLKQNGDVSLLIVARDGRSNALSAYDLDLNQIWQSDRVVPGCHELTVFSGRTRNLVVVRGGPRTSYLRVFGFALDAQSGSLVSVFGRSFLHSVWTHRAAVPLGECDESSEGLLFAICPLAGAPGIPNTVCYRTLGELRRPEAADGQK